jgi:hypothetical protein
VSHTNTCKLAELGVKHALMCIAKELTMNVQLKIQQNEPNSELDKAKHKFATLESSQTRNLNKIQHNKTRSKSMKLQRKREI